MVLLTRPAAYLRDSYPAFPYSAFLSQSLTNVVSYPSIGRCIYCGTTEGRGRWPEHIIPFALGGRHYLKRASCDTCSDITKKFKQICSRTLFGRSRIRFNLPTRRPHERPTRVDVLREMPDGTQDSVTIAFRGSR